MQMDPPVHSPIARKYGLHVSLLERLYDYVAYDSGVGMLCKTLLTENHRSHSQVGKCLHSPTSEQSRSDMRARISSNASVLAWMLSLDHSDTSMH